MRKIKCLVTLFCIMCGITTLASSEPACSVTYPKDKKGFCVCYPSHATSACNWDKAHEKPIPISDCNDTSKIITLTKEYLTEFYHGNIKEFCSHNKDLTPPDDQPNCVPDTTQLDAVSYCGN